MVQLLWDGRHSRAGCGKELTSLGRAGVLCVLLGRALLLHQHQAALRELIVMGMGGQPAGGAAG